MKIVQCTKENGQPIWVNLGQILTIEKLGSGLTRLTFVGQHTEKVKEPPEHLAQFKLS